MSVQALAWALEQDIPRSGEKFVLVVMCNYADENGVCYPSVARLERDTSMNRKTILDCLARLRDAGYLLDTGHRVGVTKGVIVHRVIRRPKNGTSTNNGTDPKNGTTEAVPNIPVSGPVFSDKQSRFYAEAVPKTGHGSVSDPSEEPSGNRGEARKRAAPSRGTRIPDDFHLTPERKAYAEAHGIADPGHTFAMFATYWQGKSGAAATKVDWDATWQHWVLKDQSNGGVPRGTTKPRKGDDSTAWAEARALAKEIGFRDPREGEAAASYATAAKLYRDRRPTVPLSERRGLAGIKRIGAV